MTMPRQVGHQEQEEQAVTASRKRHSRMPWLSIQGPLEAILKWLFRFRIPLAPLRKSQWEVCLAVRVLDVCCVLLLEVLCPLPARDGDPARPRAALRST